MTITKMMSGLPLRTMDEEPFNQAVAQLMLDWPVWNQQVNETAANLNAIAAGGAYAIPYLFDPSTTMSRPGGKYLRLNGATQATSTLLALDLIGGDLKDYTSTLGSFGGSTSSVLGTLRLIKQGDLTKFLTFNVTGVATPGSWKQLTVTCIESTSANPFASGEALILQWQRTGDKGDTGPSGTMPLLASATISSAVSTIDFLSLFTSGYEKYTVEFEGVKASSAVTLSFAVGGAVDPGFLYCTPVSPGTTVGGLSTSAVLFNTPGAQGFTGTLELRNTLGTNSLKGIGIRGSIGLLNSGAVLGEGYYSGTSAPSGFRLSGSFSGGGVIRVYGHRNT